MRQVFLEKGLIRVKEVAEPFLDDNLILVAVEYSCISPGTEGATIAQAQESMLKNVSSKLAKIMQALATHGIEGTKSLVKEKLSGPVQALGYSCSGRVVAVGKKVSRIKPGDIVACAGANLAYHAEFVAVPENLAVIIPDASLLKHASTTTLGAIALQGIRRAQLQLGEQVAVVGLGILGQLTVQLAKASGCFVYGLDVIPDRLKLAKQCGADSVFHCKQDIVEIMQMHTQRLGVDCTIITASSQSNDIIQQAMQMTRKKGRVVLVGDIGLSLERSPLYEKEIDFFVSCSYGPGRYDQEYEMQGHDYPYAYVRWTENRNMQAFVRMLAERRIDINPLISHESPVEKAEEAYQVLQEKKALCVLLSYTHHQKKEETNTQQHALTEKFLFKPAVTGKIRLGVVGIGGFAKVKLMPIVSRIKDISIQAVVDTNPSSSLRAKKLYGAARCLAHDKQLFEEDMVDAVLIASPHKYHAQQALRALKNGKAVFLEKPMATDFEETRQMLKFLQEHPDIPFCVDYNRSFAPYIQKIKKVIKNRSTPLIVHYRMNAGFIPKDHWIQTELGAGRIIGEACHIFDLFLHLVDAAPLSVSVETIKATRDDLFSTDNFCVQFTFTDGSLCSLLYTALGHKDLSKERMEVFFDGKSILMDDYKILQGFGLPSSFNEKTLISDKGHEHLLQAFFKQLSSDKFKPPIPLERLARTAHMTLIVDQLAVQGGGEQEDLNL